MTCDYDLAIVGGGLVGGSLACALRDSGLRIAIIEKVAADAPRQPSYDERVIALSFGSRRIFTGMGLWSAIAPEAEPIRRIHISDRGHAGFAHLSAAEEGVDSLGEVVPARAMGAAISHELANHPNIDWLRPGQIVAISLSGERARLEVMLPDGHRTLTASLVVAADGGDSSLRERFGIPMRDMDYGQQAIISTVTPETDSSAAAMRFEHASRDAPEAKPGRPSERRAVGQSARASGPMHGSHPGTAYERFTRSGPLAMLPMTQGRYSVVWTAWEREVPGILALDDQAFLERLQQRFGQRLGRLTQPARRQAYPLRLRLARRLIQDRFALIGNAAHTLHPVAGQGFNLGLRDVAELTDLLIEAQSTAADLGGPALLKAYQRRRRADHLATAGLTDGLVRLFSLPCPHAQLGRNLGLVGLDLLPPLRHRLARRFMGLDGQLPRLARGLPPVSPAFIRWAEQSSGGRA
ncbi:MULTISPECIES: FAD-dependent monooxygenase [Thiorhodovibrio]|uniref:FAD-dependent monooxygenase n=1 Tax=Thiorhodovibrio TaxID=61593 RepID=UPI0019147770|nr:MULTISPECIES: FAD-dependent monooxygenase [Thiorhodovibrio]MBK5969682.1 2-octaprenyl-6-methoxyphenyl hydroxylase [Thiorhodovibrio winogradskyi]WPL14536.1 2-octaprenyl-6-methoxyphenol hydroxylase [Thiorhodovibrio litoralis]